MSLFFNLNDGLIIFICVFFVIPLIKAHSGQHINTPMHVIKRDGTQQPVSFDKITKRVSTLCYDLDANFIDPVVVAKGVVSGLFSGVKTSELDNLAAETAAYMSTEHPDYAKLAARIAISNLQKDTSNSFADTIEALYTYVDPKTNLPAGIISAKVHEIVMRNREKIDAYINHTRDFAFDYFGFRTLEKSYLLKIDGKIVERPQYLFMRVALGIHMDDLEAAFETYDLMSEKWFIHASPTLFHSGTPHPQLSSCFLLNLVDDSIEGIYNTLHKCALISKSAGGIGLSIQNIRAKGSYIRGTKGYSNGLVPMLRVFDATARYVDQGGGKRPGAFAVYVEPWHPDIFEVLDLKKNTGKEESRARDLFYGLWIPDLFMERVEQDGTWSLMCPAECPGLDDCWGDKFRELYLDYEARGKVRKTIKARELWYAILTSQIETGTPYMLYKDACNSKSNQQNLGTIKCSNLCTEIVEYTSKDEVAVCNLASVVLPKFCVSNVSDVSDLSAEAIQYLQKIETNSTVCYFDHFKLYEVVKVMIRNLNKIIDINHYPIPEAQRSNMRHRPIGVGVQGLADAFQILKLPFDCESSRELNKNIFETIYFAAVDASCELAAKLGHYETYPGSPSSRGQLQFDLWGVSPSARWDWTGIKSRIQEYGLRNSLLVAPMPTASTAQILGNNECFEPYTSNLYVRRVRAGEFIVINPHLLADLVGKNLWTKDIRSQVIANGGSIADIDEIPQHLKDIYKTVWEIKQKSLIDMAADRGAYIDQSQSLNLFVSEPDFEKLTSMHFHGWKRGLKTGMYYLRTKSAAQAIQFTVDSKFAKKKFDGSKRNSTSDDTSSLGSSGSEKVYGEACISCSG